MLRELMEFVTFVATYKKDDDEETDIYIAPGAGGGVPGRGSAQGEQHGADVGGAV